MKKENFDLAHCHEAVSIFCLRDLCKEASDEWHLNDSQSILLHLYSVLMWVYHITKSSIIYLAENIKDFMLGRSTPVSPFDRCFWYIRSHRVYEFWRDVEPARSHLAKGVDFRGRPLEVSCQENLGKLLLYEDLSLRSCENRLGEIANEQTPFYQIPARIPVGGTKWTLDKGSDFHRAEALLRPFVVHDHWDSQDYQNLRSKLEIGGPVNKPSMCQNEDPLWFSVQYLNSNVLRIIIESGKLRRDKASEASLIDMAVRKGDAHSTKLLLHYLRSAHDE